MRFRIVVIAILASIEAYLVWSLGLGRLGTTLLSLAFLSVLWLPLVFWRSDREEASWHELGMQWLAFASMGFISFLWIGTLARDVVSVWVSRPLHTAEAREWIILFAALAYLIGTLNAFFGLRLRKVMIPIEKLPQALEGFRIVQLSDLHVGPTIRRRMVARMTAKVREANPDLLVLTGDAVDGTVPELSRFLAPLAELEAKHGKFYVPGNHEFYWGAPAWIDYFAGNGFRGLVNAHQTIDVGEARLLIAGVSDPAALAVSQESSKMDGPDLTKALAGAPDGAYPRILLAHQPGIAPDAEKSGFQLQLSGHTHGGQFFPWTLAARWVHRFPHGLRRIGGMLVYVSRGTGYWGPPVRLGAPSEVTLLVLTRLA